MKISSLSRLFALLTLLPILGFSQVSYRKYTPGDTYKYRLTTDVYRNDKYSGKTISVSEHHVVNDGSQLAEEITWVSKISINGADTLRLDSIAHKVSPYRISLLPNGNVLLPRLTIPQMVGEITDLNTFFVAIAPASDAQKLSAKNPLIRNPVPRQGNFADSVTILYGKDCIAMSQHLISSDKKYTIIRTDFAPPDSFCLIPLLDTVARKTFDHPNNFQMIQMGGGNFRNVLWGVEQFTITSKIDNKTGALVDATMENTLLLRMRYNTTPDLKTYAVEMPFLIKRSMHLELLSK